MNSHKKNTKSSVSKQTPKTPVAQNPAPRKIHTQISGIVHSAPDQFTIKQPALPDNLAYAMEKLLDAIDIAIPLSSAHKKDLKYAIRDLSRELTSERTERKRDYLGMPRNHSAYLRYFLPWNVLRIAQIVANLDIALHDGDSILDVGSGPWTVPIAFWIAKPELRTKHITWILGDRVKKPMESGHAIFTAYLKLFSETSNLSASMNDHQIIPDCPWEFVCKREQFPALAEKKQNKPFALITAANVLNELFWDERVHLDTRARTILESLSQNAGPDTGMLIIEPGEPRSGTMIAALRESILMNQNNLRGHIVSPCTHTNACPMPGSYLQKALRALKAGATITKAIPAPVNMPASRQKYPWCHFVLNNTPAPQRLLELSEAAGIPKERLVASWLYVKLSSKHETSPETNHKQHAASFRLISDPIRAHNKLYRYACGEDGYLMAGPPFSRFPSGTFITLNDKRHWMSHGIDKKTHALVIEQPITG